MLHNDVAIRKFDNAFYKESLIKAGQIDTYMKEIYDTGYR